MPEFVRARNDQLNAETVLPRSALPYLHGWRALDDEPAAPPAPTEAGDDTPPASTTGTTPVGRPDRPQET